MARDRAGRGWLPGVAGLLVAAAAGLWLLTGYTKQSVHPDAQAIASVTQKEPSPQWAAAVAGARRTLRASIAAENVPGLSVAVGAGGEIVWSEGFGWADLKSRVPVTPDTRFRIGTVSTALTSAAVGVLVEKGRLALDGEIQSYVPQFPKKQRALTLQQLMAHTGGLGDDRADEGALLRRRCEQPVEAVRQFAQDALLFEPGTQYRYSKYGWILVSAAVEAGAGRPFLAYMKEQIFQPLGMANTGAETAAKENPEAVGEEGEDPPPLTLIRHLILEPLGVLGVDAKPAGSPATIYAPGFGPKPAVRHGMHPMRIFNLSCYAGSMAFFSTPSDVVRFGLAMNSGKLLRPDTARLLQTPQQLAADEDGRLLGRRVASLLRFPETGIVVAVMSNRADADTAALARNVAEAFAQAARQGAGAQ